MGFVSVMTAFGAAFDNIRLIRKKIQIEQATVSRAECGPEWDAALARLSFLSDDLVQAVVDFADLGFEARIAAMIAQSGD